MGIEFPEGVCGIFLLNDSDGDFDLNGADEEEYDCSVAFVASNDGCQGRHGTAETKTLSCR